MMGTQAGGTAPCQPCGSVSGPPASSTGIDSREAGKAAGAPDSGGITGITETGIIVTSSTLSACTKGRRF